GLTAPSWLLCCLACLRSPVPLHPPSFPTRRSSDLCKSRTAQPAATHPDQVPTGQQPANQPASFLSGMYPGKAAGRKKSMYQFQRSEEHTSELQSRENLVCRLLLEKKNQTRLKCDAR